MTGSALLTLIATILTVQGGIVDIDLGRNGGLEAGDQGVIFYEIGVGDQVRTIEVGVGTVIEASSYTAKLQMTPEVKVRSGFLVRFEIPRARLSGDSDALATINTTAAIDAVVSNTDDSCLNVRPLPEISSPALTCIPEGTPVSLIDSLSGWKKVRLTDGREGWVAARYLSGPGARTSAVAARPTPAAPPRPEPTEPTTDEALGEIDETPAPTRLAELDEQLRTADTTVNELRLQLVENQTALSEAERTRSQITRRLLQTTVAELESELSMTKAELAQTEHLRASLSSQIETLVDDRRRLKEELTRAELDALESTEERDRIELELASVSSDLSQIQAVAEAAKEALRREIQHTETTLAGLRSELESTQQELAAKDARLEVLELEQSSLLDQLAELETSSKSELKREAKVARRALKKAEHEREELEELLERRNRQLADTQEETRQLEAELDQRESADSASEARIAQLTSERDQLAGQLDEMREQLGGDSDSPSLQAVVEDAEFELNRLRAELDRVTLEAADNADALEAAQQELDSLRDQRSLATGGPIEDLSDDMQQPSASLVVLPTADPCLNFRSEPSLTSRRFECLDPGTSLGPLGHWEGWLYVKLDDGRAGWVSDQHVGPVGVGGGDTGEAIGPDGESL